MLPKICPRAAVAAIIGVGVVVVGIFNVPGLLPRYRNGQRRRYRHGDNRRIQTFVCAVVVAAVQIRDPAAFGTGGAMLGRAIVGVARCALLPFVRRAVVRPRAGNVGTQQHVVGTQQRVADDNFGNRIRRVLGVNRRKSIQQRQRAKQHQQPQRYRQRDIKFFGIHFRPL